MAEDKTVPAQDSPDKKDLTIEEAKKALEDCEKLRNEYLAGWQRARADFLNYKKEEMERIGEIIKYANLELIFKILPILDNFEIATRQNFFPENLSGQGKNDKVIQGFLQIKEQLQDFLKSQDIEEIKSVGGKFDPNLHEVMEEVEDKEKEKGIIVEEIQKGYKINGKLLRSAKVKVAK